MAEQKTYTSPCIVALERALSTGDIATLEAFWQDIAQYGAPLIPLRFYMEVGLQEKDGRVSIMVPPNHDVEYTKFNGDHDYVCWRGSLADGLIALVGRH